MRRRVIGNLVFCVSALLLIASALAWYCSHQAAYDLSRTGVSNDCGISITVEQFGLWMRLGRTDKAQVRWRLGQDPLPIDFRKLRFYPESIDLRMVGFRFVREKSTAGGDYYLLQLPLWLMTAASGAVVLGLIWRRWHASKRVATGHCPVCGYDLRASPERCPECGTPRALPSSETAASVDSGGE